MLFGAPCEKKIHAQILKDASRTTQLASEQHWLKVLRYLNCQQVSTLQKPNHAFLRFFIVVSSG